MIRGLALLLVSGAVFAAAVMWAALRLPIEGVAVHVDSHGTVNGYATRAQTMTLFAAIGGWVGGLAVVTVAAVRWLPVRMVKVPRKDHWAEPARLPRLRRMMVWDRDAR